MKKLIIILFLIPFFVNGQIKKDAYSHASAGAILSGGMYSIGYYSKRDMNPVAPALIAFTGGFAKEMYDSFQTGNFSGRDLLITTVSGAITNYTLSLLWKKKKQKKYIDFNEDKFELVENARHRENK